VVTPLYRQAMPLLRYNIEDEVEVCYGDCDCGWQLPTVRVAGRSGAGHPVGRATVTQSALEELVFGLPLAYQVMFWRAHARPDRLRVEFEAPEQCRAAAQERLRAGVRAALAVDAEVVGLAPGSLVPRHLLATQPDVVKPRSLFGPDEDWDSALLYY
jgi:phenylacetate-CoA ligase